MNPQNKKMGLWLKMGCVYGIGLGYWCYSGM
jgi:hypothetical protein